MDEVVAHLNGKDAFSESDLQTNILLGFTDFERILMDSRTCRLVELLGHLPREEGRVKSQAICDQMYEEFEATIERVLASYEDPTAPKNHKSVITNKLALGAAIFAMAHFSGPEPVIRKVQRIDELARKARSRLQRNEAPSLPNCDLFSYMSIPDANFKVNVIAFAVNHGSPENRSRQSRVTGLLATIPTRGLWRETHDGLQKLVIYDWDQYSTYYRRNQGKILQTLIQACREDD
jgi:hypothetical protein